MERLAQGAAGVKRTTGQHPGGIVVIPNYMDVYDFTPVQYPADDVTAEWQTTHFNFHDIDENVLKLDVLGHDDPTMIRKLQDLSGIDPNDIPMDDSGVMALFSGTDILGVTPEQIGTSTGMLGIPEFGTNFVRGMVDETHPTTFAELLQLSGLSHGTDVWLGNAQDLIKAGIADQFVNRQFGQIIALGYAGFGQFAQHIGIYAVQIAHVFRHFTQFSSSAVVKRKSFMPGRSK